MEEKSTFGLALKPGLIISGAVIAYSLVVWSVTDNVDQMKYLSWVNYIILAIGYYIFTKNYRDDYKNGALTFGEGFVFMLFISVVYSVIQSLYTYIFMTFIDPDMVTQMVEKVEESLYNNNLPEEQIEQSMKMMSFMFKPWLISLMAVFGTMLWGTFLSLIMAFFTKKTAEPTFEN